MIRYIVLNGKPTIARSILARELSKGLSKHGTVMNDSFYAPVKHLVAVTLGARYADLDRNKMRAEFRGESVQDFVREIVLHLRKRYGSDVFGRWLVHRTLRYPSNKPMFVVVDDGRDEDDISAIDHKFIVALDGFIGSAYDIKIGQETMRTEAGKIIGVLTDANQN